MKITGFPAFVVMLAVFLGGVRGAEEVDGLDVYYFGNSYTGCTAPALHEKLAASAGKTWTNIANLGAGWPLWYHLHHQRQGAKGGMRLVNGEYALNPEFKAENWQAATFHQQKWDAIMLQAFGFMLRYGPVSEAWDGKVKFDRPTDIGDIQSSVDLIKIYLETVNPDGAVYVFQSWPGNPLVRKAGQTQGKELNHRQIEPIRRSFDFPRQWFQLYDPDAMPWEGGGSHTRDYEYLLMDALIEAYPELWGEGRLRLMPVVDVWSLLDRRIRAGKVSGMDNIGEFHTDGGHTRAGLPAYVCAATFYTMFFRDRPHKLDYTIFNDRSNYGKDLFNDWGELLEITPDLAGAVNDAIWEVVQAHPYTGFGGSEERLQRLEGSVACPEPLRVLEFGSTDGALPSRTQCALPVWQPDVDRSAGKPSWWDVHYRSWYTLSRYAHEMKEGSMKEAYHQLIDKNWKSHRLDRLILNPAGHSDAEAEGAAWLAGQFLDHHPDGEVLIYFTWPEMKSATALRRRLKLEPWQSLPEEQAAPLRRSFEYAAVWQAETPVHGNAACAESMLERIKSAVPEDQAERVRVIPAGALLAELDKKLKAGALPGVSGVGQFYKDGTMLRTGLPRYALAALRHAVLHQAHPGTLDAAPFNDPKAYPPDALDPETPKGQLNMTIKDEEYDNGPHFPITPEAKKLVDETIWEMTRR